MEGLGIMDFKQLATNPHSLPLTWRLAPTLYCSDSFLLLMLHAFMLSYLNDAFYLLCPVCAVLELTYFNLVLPMATPCQTASLAAVISPLSASHCTR